MRQSRTLEGGFLIENVDVEYMPAFFSSTFMYALCTTLVPSFRNPGYD
jgi:hypothetical protein